MRLRIILVMGLLALTSNVSAQQMLCPGTGIPMSQDPGCMTPNMNSAPAQQWPSPAPQPTGYWETTWGAIAPSPDKGVLGTAVSAGSKEEAGKIALAECKEKGGGACEVEFAYDNQCAAMVLGNERYGFASGTSVDRASKLAMKRCKERGDSECRVYYTACSKPIFHKY